MKYFYKNPVSGRYTFVTLQTYKGELWTNEKCPVKASSIDLQSFSNLEGLVIKLNEHIGIIKDCLPVDKLETGKYIGDNFYISHSTFNNYNNLVRIAWKTGTQSCWQPLHKITWKK